MLSLRYNYKMKQSLRNIPKLAQVKDVMQLGNNSHLKEVLKVLSTNEGIPNYETSSFYRRDSPPSPAGACPDSYP